MLRNLVVLLVVAVFLLSQGPQAWNTARSWLGFDSWDWWKRDAVISPERAKELAAKGLREQVISFSEGMSAIEYRSGIKAEDQRYDIYAIGVGQMTLGTPEERASVEKVVVTGSRIKQDEAVSNVDLVPTYPISGQFNNILLFDRRAGELIKVFDSRIAISEFQLGWRTKPGVLVIFATDRDSNKDGKLGHGDLQDIYIYALADRKLHKVDARNISPVELMDVPEAEYIIVKALVDRDADGDASEYEDGDYSTRESPFTLVRVDLKTFTASSFVPDKMLHDLQSTLDGPKPPPVQPPR